MVTEGKAYLKIYILENTINDPKRSLDITRNEAVSADERFKLLKDSYDLINSNLKSIYLKIKNDNFSKVFQTATQFLMILF